VGSSLPRGNISPCHERNALVSKDVNQTAIHGWPPEDFRELADALLSDEDAPSVWPPVK
jgi:hypothetical protein